ncbi:MAG TPA: TonB-dependent receptor [Opitutaceae bacterium]|nr:TonB-dependent receptor [Opitutaceae bacterium]
MSEFRRAAVILTSSALWVGTVSGHDVDFASLTLEELADIQISSLGRKRTAVFSTPGAASIITSEDIRQSGATDLATAIRLAPGLQVARTGSSGYAISARGFNDATSSKLLVLMDGRSIYSQLTGGVQWAYQTVMLPDVARIEVLRGPAASLWGTNAVNGVINVVSKSAHETLGSFVTVAHGDELRADVAVRQGVRLNPSSALRVYGSYQNNGNYGAGRAMESHGWETQLVGARYDWERRNGGGFTLIGEYREADFRAGNFLPSLLPPYISYYPDPTWNRGANVIGRWVMPIGQESELRVQGSFERQSSRHSLGSEVRNVGDFDLQLTSHPLPRHDLLAGFTYRRISDDIESSPWLRYGVASASTQFYGAFIQDEISLIPQQLSFTIGAKFERNSYTGWEPQPSARILWHPSKNNSLWAGVSRAARIPSRSEHGVELLALVVPPTPEFPLPTAVTAVGSSSLDSEHLISYEVGHRFKWGSQFSIDTALFYNDYNDLRGIRPESVYLHGNPVPHFRYDLVAINNLHGRTYGGEVTVRWEPVSFWKVDGSVASLRTHLGEDRPGLTPDVSLAALEGNSPREEYKLRSRFTWAKAWELDIIGRSVGRLPAPNVPAYTNADVRLAWSPNAHWTFELVGRDILDSQHPEISTNFLGTELQEVSRNFYARVTFRY